MPPAFQIAPLRENIVKQSAHLKHGDVQLHALQAGLAGGNASLQPAHQVVLLPGRVVGAGQHGGPVHDQLRELPNLDVVLHGFLTQIVHGNLALSTKILCLDLCNDVHTQGADEAAQREAQGLVREPNQELPHEVGCEGLYGLGHLVLTETRIPEEGFHVDDLHRAIHSVLIFKGTGS